ncbi:hypothetical protein DID88_006279 [Monilinia fructigena]|uniref:Uncharacterized protein n=1 Tax=Monilinia fructigena TaxID=38457 RepID=A0A395J7C1_9HELO|nr:hypothetical protein DID88_006279 [Monilinia fructigena]
MQDFKASSSASSSPKRASRHAYTSVPASDLPLRNDEESTSNSKNNSGGIHWFSNDSLGKKGNRSSAQNSRPHSQQKSSTSIKSSYHPLPLDPSTIGDYEEDFHLPDPLMENPPTPRHNFPSSSSNHSSQAPSTSTPDNNEYSPSADIIDESSWPLPLLSPEIRELTPKPLRTRDSGSSDSFKSKYYGDLKPSTPPVTIGGDNIGRQVSSGTDFVDQRESYRRDVSGKIAEEGRGGGAWGTRLRNISGLQAL